MYYNRDLMYFAVTCLGKLLTIHDLFFSQYELATALHMSRQSGDPSDMNNVYTSVLTAFLSRLPQAQSDQEAENNLLLLRRLVQLESPLHNLYFLVVRISKSH